MTHGSIFMYTTPLQMYPFILVQNLEVTGEIWEQSNQIRQIQTQNNNKMNHNETKRIWTQGFRL